MKYDYRQQDQGAILNFLSTLKTRHAAKENLKKGGPGGEDSIDKVDAFINRHTWIESVLIYGGSVLWIPGLYLYSKDISYGWTMLIVGICAGVCGIIYKQIILLVEIIFLYFIRIAEKTTGRLKDE